MAIISAGLFFILLVAYIIFCYRRSLPYKKMLVGAGLLLTLASLGTAFYFWKNEKTANIQNTIKNTLSGESLCGNALCEPDLGENKNNCPKDCLNSEE